MPKAVKIVLVLLVSLLAEAPKSEAQFIPLCRDTGSGPRQCTGPMSLGLLPAHASTHLQAGSDPIIVGSTSIVASTTLTTANRLVYVNTPNPITLTLPTAPPTNTEIEVVVAQYASGGAARGAAVTVAAGGSDGIFYTNISNVVLPAAPAAIKLKYSSGNWHIISGFSRQDFVIRFDSAASGDYLQNGDITLLSLGTAPVLYRGGPAGTAMGLAMLTSTVIAGHLTCQTRSNVAANHTVQLVIVTSAFAVSVAALIIATIPTGSNFGYTASPLVSATNMQTGPKNWLVMQAVTAITTPMECQVSLWML